MPQGVFQQVADRKTHQDMVAQTGNDSFGTDHFDSPSALDKLRCRLARRGQRESRQIEWVAAPLRVVLAIGQDQ